MSDCTLGKLGEQWHRERERVGDRCYQLVESLLGFKVPWSFLMLPLEGSLRHTVGCSPGTLHLGSLGPHLPAQALKPSVRMSRKSPMLQVCDSDPI